MSRQTYKSKKTGTMIDKEQFEIISKLDVAPFQKMLLEVFSQQIATHKVHKEYITKKECMEILGIKSPTTLQKLRDEQAFQYARVGGIYLYKYSSIMEFLEEKSTESKY
jgi:hypothetical protein